MITLKKILILGLFLMAHFLIVNAQEYDLPILEKELEASFAKKDEYAKSKENQINNLRNELNTNDLKAKDQYKIYQQLFDAYEFYVFDSALYYGEKSLILSKKQLSINDLQWSRAKLASLLISSGRYMDATDLIKEVEEAKIESKDLKKFLLKVKLELYSRLDYYKIITDENNDYKKKYQEVRDSMLHVFPPNSFEVLSIKEKEYRDQRKLDSALLINDQKLKSVIPFSRNYAITTFERSLIYDLKENQAERKKFLIISALSDIKSAIKDNASLTDLAGIAYREGDLTKAHDYIGEAMEDADFYNSHFRYVNISYILPIITKSYEEHSEKQQKKLFNAIVLISLLSLVLLFSSFLIYQQMKKSKKKSLLLDDLNKKLTVRNLEIENINQELNIAHLQLQSAHSQLEEMNEVKEEYIGKFIHYYSEFMNKLDAYKKRVINYLQSDNLDKLKNFTESDEFVNTEIQSFYTNFDYSFLKIHPNFVEQVNLLLKPEERFTQLAANSLNTELRICALIRLGIDQSSQISNILGYSVNTIYNYRAKIKNSALDKIQFEKDIKTIK